ncbi:hypothetical protein GNI_024780 [Gregarina niphandrodes]|uniref:Transmembrane protein n=1 Tax=Gregarina niphandrodes TaxID=110365 RepID=A0A023BBE4_GRENI|nr:hypothetical protein GNI_024780 [Gregarina niphandrodes]EZG79655.1 hypothetical protein GNI_024780 [Gregarina niphandrodes]|eukprot:XP_011134400.1 hypothetical protein GNI_024780 [Gregarina niphandrodes]
MNTRILQITWLFALAHSLDPMSLINSVLEQLLSQTQSSVETASAAQSNIDAEQLEASLEEMKAAQAEASKQKAEAMAQEAELSNQAKPVQEQTLKDAANQLILGMADLSASVLKLDQNMKGKEVSSVSAEQKDDIKLTIHMPSQKKTSNETLSGNGASDNSSGDNKTVSAGTDGASAGTDAAKATGGTATGGTTTGSTTTGSADMPVTLLIYDAVDPTRLSVLEKRLTKDPSTNVNSGYSRRKADDYDVSLKEQAGRARKRAVLAGKRAQLFEDLAKTTAAAAGGTASSADALD